VPTGNIHLEGLKRSRLREILIPVGREGKCEPLKRRKKRRQLNYSLRVKGSPEEKEKRRPICSSKKKKRLLEDVHIVEKEGCRGGEERIANFR